MELIREQRYLELLVVLFWAAVIRVQFRRAEAYVRGGETWDRLGRISRIARVAGVVLLVTAAVLLTETSTWGWAHALLVPTLVGLFAAETQRKLTRRLRSSDSA